MCHGNVYPVKINAEKYQSKPPCDPKAMFKRALFPKTMLKQDVIFCKKIPHGTPLYEGGPNSEESNDLLFEGTTTLMKLKIVNETLTVCKEFSL